MSVPDLFGDSFVDQTLKESFTALTNENHSLNSRIDQLEVELAAMQQANQFLTSQLSLVQDDLLAQSSEQSIHISNLSNSYNAALSIIENQNVLVTRQIALFVNL